MPYIKKETRQQDGTVKVENFYTARRKPAIKTGKRITRLFHKKSK